MSEALDHYLQLEERLIDVRAANEGHWSAEEDEVMEALDDASHTLTQADWDAVETPRPKSKLCVSDVSLYRCLECERRQNEAGR